MRYLLICLLFFAGCTSVPKQLDLLLLMDFDFSELQQKQIVWKSQKDYLVDIVDKQDWLNQGEIIANKIAENRQIYMGLVANARGVQNNAIQHAVSYSLRRANPVPDIRIAKLYASMVQEQNRNIEVYEVGTSRTMYPTMDWDTLVFVEKRSFAVSDVVMIARGLSTYPSRVIDISGNAITVQGDNETISELVHRSNILGICTGCVYYNTLPPNSLVASAKLKENPTQLAPTRNLAYAAVTPVDVKQQ